MFNILKKKQPKKEVDYFFYIIDDEEDVLEILTELVEQTFSCKTKSFSHLDDALKELKKEMVAPNLIYSDIMMGKESGLSMIKTINELGHNIPILFITGLSGEEGLQDGHYSINKPVSKASLIKYTTKLLSLSTK